MTPQVSLRREEILRALRDSRPLLDAFGVARLSLFGSFARDEGRQDSDVDLLVEFSRPVGLFESIGTVALASLLVLSPLSALGQTLPEIARLHGGSATHTIDILGAV
jgi:predicted nucleotidyltransferase